MLSSLFEAQEQLEEIRREGRKARAEIHKNAEAAIAKIYADTEATKAKLDQDHAYNMDQISKFQTAIETCTDSAELAKMGHEMLASLRNYW